MLFNRNANVCMTIGIHIFHIKYVVFFLVISTLNTKFKKTLAEVKQLHNTALMQKVGQLCVTAEKIIYDHAMQMVSELSPFYA